MKLALLLLPMMIEGSVAQTDAYGCDNGTLEATSLTVYSWHIHYTWKSNSQSHDVKKFHTAMVKKFSSYGAGDDCNFGPNYVGGLKEDICDLGSPSSPHPTKGGCGSDTSNPWEVCEYAFWLPNKYKEEVVAYAQTQRLSLDLMVHPNTGCMWGDHTANQTGRGRGVWHGDNTHEMRLWNFPCNTVAQGCSGDPNCGCDDIDGTQAQVPQHCKYCVDESNSTVSDAMKFGYFYA